MKGPNTEPGGRESESDENGIMREMPLLGNAPDMGCYQKAKHNACGPQVSFHFYLKIGRLKEFPKEGCCFIGDADDLVRGLTIEFEVELGFGSAIVPGGKRFELTPAQAPLRERGAPDGDAHARRLPGDPAFLCDRPGRRDDAGGDETRPAFVLTCEDEDTIAFGDALAAIHRLLGAEHERLCPRLVCLRFDREHHVPSLTRLVSWSLGRAHPERDERRPYYKRCSPTKLSLGGWRRIQ